MAKFRKKPVVVDAVQLTSDNWDEVCEFVPRPCFGGGVYIDRENNPIPDGVYSERWGLYINTDEGKVLAVQGDWIVKGDNEFYLRKPDVFYKDYEPESESDLTFEQCLREEFLVNTQNFPKEYHDLFHTKFERVQRRFESQRPTSQ